MRGLLLSVLLVVIVQQPAAGVVFVLDGVLIGAGDQDYLAVAGLVTLAVFGAAATIVVRTGGGLVALWVAYAAWMAGQARDPDAARARLALAGDRRGPAVGTGSAQVVISRAVRLFSVLASRDVADQPGRASVLTGPVRARVQPAAGLPLPTVAMV